MVAVLRHFVIVAMVAISVVGCGKGPDDASVSSAPPAKGASSTAQVPQAGAVTPATSASGRTRPDFSHPAGAMSAVTGKPELVPGSALGNK